MKTNKYNTHATHSYNIVIFIHIIFLLYVAFRKSSFHIFVRYEIMHVSVQQKETEIMFMHIKI